MSKPKNSNDLAHIELMLSTLDRTLTRRNKINDPVQRHLLLIDTLTIAIDFGLAGMKTMIDDKKEDKDGVENPEHANIMRLYESVSDQTTKQLEMLTDWIQQPTYGPDHPYGRSIYNKAAEEFSGYANTETRPSLVGYNKAKNDIRSETKVGYNTAEEPDRAEKRAYANIDSGLSSAGYNTAEEAAWSEKKAYAFYDDNSKIKL